MGKTEERAVTAVKYSFKTVGCVSVDVRTNDSTPTWDGVLFVYNNNSHKKREMLGRIPIQVKGRFRNHEIVENEVAFSVEVSDLRNYLNDGGAIYFVVLLDKNNEFVFYKQLLPFDLKQLLKGCSPKQAKVPVHFERFPVDDNDKFLICRNFLNDKKRQALIISNDIPPKQLEDMQETVVHFETSSGIDYVLNHPTYMYKVDPLYGFYIPIAVGKFAQATSERDIKISVCGTVYYDHAEIIHTAQDVELRLNKSMSLCFHKKNGKMSELKIKPSNNGTLLEEITNNDFLYELLKNNRFEVNGAVCEVSCNDNRIDAISRVEDRLGYLQKIKQVLCTLGIEKDLELTYLTNIGAERMIDAFVYGKSISLNETLEFFYSKLQFANLNVLLFFTKDNDGKYKVKNYFSEMGGRFTLFDEEKKENVLASKYCLLKSEHFETVDNINYDIMCDDLLSIPPNEIYSLRLNQLLLEMLATYDSTRNRKLLDVAARVADNLIDKHGSNVGFHIAKLNQLQIYKRFRELSSAEMVELDNIIENSDDASIQAGAYILKNDKQNAIKSLALLPTEDQEQFKTYPIYNLCVYTQSVAVPTST